MPEKVDTSINEWFLRGKGKTGSLFADCLSFEGIQFSVLSCKHVRHFQFITSKPIALA